MALSDHFGDSAHFVVFDTDRQTCVAHACETALCRGPCHCHLPALAGRAFDAVICRHIGARAFAMLRRQQIDVLLTQDTEVAQALQNWEAHRLPAAKRPLCRLEEKDRDDTRRARRSE